MNRDGAELLALDALAFLAQDEAALTGLMVQTGSAPGDLRRRAADPDFLAGVLDYLAGDEGRAEAFSRARGLAPGALLAARRLLPGGAGDDWA